MGSIASVLQWHCSECSLINPTETVQCARCGLSRIKSDKRATSTYLLHDSLIQCSKTSRTQSTTYSSSGSSTPPTPPPRHQISLNNTNNNLSTLTTIKLKEPIKLPSVPALQQNQYETYVILRYNCSFLIKTYLVYLISFYFL
jgi:hypothetical protein